MIKKRLIKELEIAYSTLNRLLDDRWSPQDAINQARARCNKIESELDLINATLASP